MNRKEIRKNCPHYGSGGWCRNRYNTATQTERERYDKMRQANKPIHPLDELRYTCYPEKCEIWIEELIEYKNRANAAFLKIIENNKDCDGCEGDCMWCNDGSRESLEIAKEVLNG